MTAVHGVFAASLLSVVCHAGIIPLETIKSVAHPKYKPDTYAQFGDHDVDCGHIAIVKRGDERKCQERCHQYSTLLKEDCNAYTFKSGKNGGESSCVLKNYRCRPSNWKKKHNSGLLGGCAYWCDKVPRGVDMSVCRNSDGSRWSCHSEDLQQGRQGGGKSQDTRRPENPKGPNNAGGPKDVDHNGSPNDPKHPRQGGSNGPKDGNHTGGEGHHTGGRNNSHHSGDSDDHHHPEGNDHHHSGGSSDHHHSGGSNDRHHAGGGRDPKDPHHSVGSNGPKDPHHPGGPKDPKDPHHPGGPKDPHHPGGPKDPHHPGGPKNPHHPDHPDHPGHPDQPHHPHHPHHPGPSQRAKPKAKSRANLDFPFGILRRDMSDACPTPMTACPVVKSDGTLGEGLDCVETDQDLNQCGGCLGTGGVDCEKIAHAEIVGCSSGRCKVLRCAEGFYAKGDTCFRKLGQIIFDNPNGY